LLQQLGNNLRDPYSKHFADGLGMNLKIEFVNK